MSVSAGIVSWEAAARTSVLCGGQNELPWELWQRIPPAQMTGLVAGLWAGSSPHAFARHRTLPNGELMLMFHLGPAQRLIELDGRPCRTSLGYGFLSGLQERPATFETLEPHTRVAAARLLPVGSWLLLEGLPQAELTGCVIDVEEAFGRRSGVRALLGRMGDAPDLGGSLDWLEAWLLERLKRARPAHPVTRAVGSMLREVRGSLWVEALATVAGVSPRYLRDLFQREVGVSPKRLARILRFREVLERLATKPAVDLTHLALECGYYDQSHLYRDFRELASLTPPEYLAALGDGLDGPLVVSG